MDYKQKYEKALETVQEILSSGADLIRIKKLKLRLQSVFPELKENEDERIRKTIYGWIYTQPSEFFDNGFSKEEMLAWLEKQGEKKHFSDFKAKDWYISKVDGKIHNMTYNPTNKVEPKFKVGDWITDGHLICKVLSVTGKSYELHLHNDDYCHFETDIQSVDKYYRLWTIKDAKEGNILVPKSPKEGGNNE